MSRARKTATRMEIFVAMNKFEKNDLVYIDDMMLLEIGK